MLDLIYHVFISVFIAFLKYLKVTQPSRKLMDSLNLAKRYNLFAINRKLQMQVLRCSAHHPILKRIFALDSPFHSAQIISETACYNGK